MRPAAGLLLSLAAATAAADDAVRLEPVTVTATRVEKSAFEVPAALDRVDLSAPGLGISLTEGLQAVPGLSARDRGNYAQDAQISIRGFGARSAFGIRGVRLYADGVPATQPDGQGQISQFNLATADRVEVLRGPFSALYGNAAGGVVQLFTADATTTPQLDIAGFAGAYGDQRFSLVGQGAGAIGGLTVFKTDGYRPHSAAQRRSLNLKVGRAVVGGDLTLLLNHLDAPDAQDPLGLTRAQLDSDPRQTAAAATLFDTRKSTRQTQLGAVYQGDETRWGALRLVGYGGQRQIGQFLAIPVATQSNPRHAGGVVDLASDYGGGDARWSTPLFNSFSLVGGVSLDTLRQHRRGFENFSGALLGVQGAPRRDEINKATAIDQYLQFDWTPLPELSALAGLRHSQLRFSSDDRYITATNPDDSGQLRYAALTPVAGLLWRQSAALHWHLSYGTGFETPTLAELAYRPDGNSGLNTELAPSRSRNGELGFKWRPTAGTRVAASVFRTEARNELVTATNSGGRATYSNAAATRRDGAELSLETQLGSSVNWLLAYTALDATVRKPYLSCTRVPCTVPDTRVAKGTPLAGVAKRQIFSRLQFKATPAWLLAAEYRALSSLPVNDQASEFAPAYGVLDAESVFSFTAPDLNALRLSLRIDNIFDAQYAGSVIVNDSNGRYYEPARGRTARLGLEMRLK